MWSVAQAYAACRHRCLGQAKLLVGCPMVSSPGNMRFWLNLCQAAKAPGAEETIQGFSAAAKAGKEVSRAYCLQYNTELMQKVKLADMQRKHIYCHHLQTWLCACYLDAPPLNAMLCVDKAGRVFKLQVLQSYCLSKLLTACTACCRFLSILMLLDCM